ncbi:hypothetical protein GWI33_021144 [Rhynchophorus ferrugineus]|uniref:Uncharacterized protein n=1 Tax=Rhynchophorus ferrugineus TaxID=354439 RepID=A0A834HNB9_RHYFE|nr:hypothetical protein GWI33_021144 [Rhynchophorus ferrugineus]
MARDKTDWIVTLVVPRRNSFRLPCACLPGRKQRSKREEKGRTTTAPPPAHPDPPAGSNVKRVTRLRWLIVSADRMFLNFAVYGRVMSLGRLVFNKFEINYPGASGVLLHV